MAPKRTREKLSLTDGNLQLDLAAVSDVGVVRSENQDGWRIAQLASAPGCTFLLADGMGGVPGGKQASETALDVTLRTIVDAIDPHLAIADAFAAADEAVGEYPDAGGTTLVGVVLSNGRVRVANVGDSRAYVLRGPHLVPITQDHSVVAEQVRLGNIDEAQAHSLPGRNLLTRAVTGANAEVDFFDLPVVPGDVMLLCSDGLWGVVSDQELNKYLSQSKSAAQIADKLCDAALKAGSTDNVTIVICRID